MESFDLNRVIIVIIWLALISGAAISCFGLLQKGRKYSEWKRLKAQHNGDILPVDNRLQEGLTGSIAPAIIAPAELEPTFFYAELASVETKYLVVTMELDPGTAQGSSISVEKSGISAGSAVNLTITSDNALYQLNTVVVSSTVDPDRKGRVTLRLARPFWMARIQRRKFVRVPLKADALFDHAEISTNAPDPMMGQIVNLSGGGVRVEMGRTCSPIEAAEILSRYEPGTLLRFRLGLPAFRGNALLARVCTRERTAERGGLGVQIACEFMPMASWELELLISHVFRAERDMLKSRFQARQPAA